MRERHEHSDSGTLDGLSIFSLLSGRDLAERICHELGIRCGVHEEREFEDGEHKIRPLESVRGRDVYVVESLYGEDNVSVDQKLVRMLFFLMTLRDAGARRLTAVTPYLCYARKDRRTKARDPVSARYLAALFEAARIDRLVAVDVHNPAAFQNAFRVPTEHLTAAPAFVDALRWRLAGSEVMVLSPDSGGVKRAEAFRQQLERRLGRPVGLSYLDKYRSEGIVRSGAISQDVAGRRVIIVDDLICSGTTMALAARACREQGARGIYAVATHGAFTASASRVLQESPFDHIVILDTIPVRRLDSALLRCRVEIVDCAPLLASAIFAIHTGGSLVELAAKSADEWRLESADVALPG